MEVGDITLKCSIGDVSLNDDGKSFVDRLVIHESLFKSAGPGCEIYVVDPSDVASNFTGSYDKPIKIDISTIDGDICSFEFKQFENSDLNNEAQQKRGSAKFKSYCIKGVTAEMLNVQGNNVESAYRNKKSTDIVEDVLKKNYKTQLTIRKDSQSDEQIHYVAANKHPFDVIGEDLPKYHKSNKDKSSVFLPYYEHDNGKRSYVIDNIENMFKKPTKAKFTLSTTLDSSEGSYEKKKSQILSYNVPQNFTSATRSTTQASERTINYTTHGVTHVPAKEYQPKLLGVPVSRGKTSYHKEKPVRTVLDKKKYDQRVSYSTSKTDRAKFYNDLSQNLIEIEVIGQKISLGSIIEIELPNNVDDSVGASSESQLNGKILVSEITHYIEPAGTTPRYKMVVKGFKASYERGGGTA